MAELEEHISREDITSESDIENSSNNSSQSE